MDNQNKSLFSMLENYFDMIINIAAIYVAYFFTILINGNNHINATSPFSVIWILITVILAAFVYQAMNTYKTKIFIKRYMATVSIIKANIVIFGAIALMFLIFASDERRQFLLTWTLLCFIFSSVFLSFKKNLIISVTLMLHKKQYKLRRVLVVGDNMASAKEFIKQVSENPQYGMMVIGYVGNKSDPELACEKLGVFKELSTIIDENRPTDVVFAIDAYDKRHIIKLVNICDDKCVKMYFLPVIYGFFKTAKQLDSIGSLPIITVHNTPLDNRANAAIKRVIDIIGSIVLIVATSPLMLIAAIGIKLSSPGPILFKQERVGKMGQRFTMLKFRSMKVNYEQRWTTDTDSRKTRFGTFIRRTAIDELPQLFNVLTGSMSLVGPRPEIPKFVAEFKEVIPLYMVKHYVKPGMTGLAQIKGLRGDTSVEDRIHTDIYYIENWSLLLDISILLRTPFRAFNKNEKYISNELAELPELYGGPAEEDLHEIHELLSEEYGHTESEPDQGSKPRLTEQAPTALTEKEVKPRKPRASSKGSKPASADKLVATAPTELTEPVEVQDKPKTAKENTPELKAEPAEEITPELKAEPAEDITPEPTRDAPRRGATQLKVRDYPAKRRGADSKKKRKGKKK